MMSAKRLFTTLLPLYTIISHTTAWTTTTSTSTSISMMSSSSTGGPKIAVVGGTGFVGSRVCRSLVESGASVTSISRTGTIPKWCTDEPWTKEVSWVSLDLLANDESKADEAVGNPEAMVSCVGVVGTDRDELLKGNGGANAAAFASGKRGGMLKRTVLVSVASEVAACEENWLPDFFGGYFEGKKIAEEAAKDAADGGACTIVAPSFIYGGDSFGLLPPRVTADYGSAIEQLLSYGIITFLGDVAPGLIGVALRPPSSVDAVAAACAKAALEEGSGGMIDGGAAINAATDYPASTGLSEAITWAKDGTIEAYEWVKAKIDENAEKR